jgi:hypothetical protein
MRRTPGSLALLVMTGLCVFALVAASTACDLGGANRDLLGGIRAGADLGATTGTADLGETSTSTPDGSVVDTALPPPTTNPNRVILTQRRGNALRTRILDTLRRDPRLGSERGTKFVVQWLAVQGHWAFFQGLTEVRLAPVEALLHSNTAGTWRVVEMAMTNGRKIAASRYASAPQAIWGPPSFSLAPRAKASSDLLILTNARGNSTRSAILDSLRGEFTPQTLFSVEWLRVKGGWAYFQGMTLPYNMPIDAILRHRSWGWEVVEVQGEGDFPVSIPDKYSGSAPNAIFP